METTRAPMASANLRAARPACSSWTKTTFTPAGTGLVNELLQVLGRWFFAVVLNGELVQAEITGEVAECGVIDDESALVLLVE